MFWCGCHEAWELIHFPITDARGEVAKEADGSVRAKIELLYFVPSAAKLSIKNFMLLHVFTTHVFFSIYAQDSTAGGSYRFRINGIYCTILNMYACNL